MPIYEYRCEKCGYTFEVITGFSKNGVRKCERCGARAKRLIYPAGIIFKGSGFHVTDYKKTNPVNKRSKSGKDIASKPSQEGEAK